MCQKKIFEYVFLSIVWLLLSIIVVFPVHATVIPAATVLSAGSGVWVERAGKRVPLQQQDPVFEGDVIITNGTGRVQIVFSDDTIAAIGPNTQIQVSEFSFSAVSSSKFKADVSRGMVRFITGKIVERNREGFTVDTPQATIGIRGTTFSVAVSDGGVTVVSAIAVKSAFPIDVRNIATGTHSLLDTAGGAVDVSMSGNAVYMGRGATADVTRFLSKMIAFITSSSADTHNDFITYSAGIRAVKIDPGGMLSLDFPMTGKPKQPADWFGVADNRSFVAATSFDIRDFSVDSTRMTSLGNIWMMKGKKSTDD